MKLCKDCRHYTVEYNSNRCYAPENGINLVTGEFTHRGCEAQRSYSTSVLPGYCGHQGFFFQPIIKDTV